MYKMQRPFFDLFLTLGHPRWIFAFCTRGRGDLCTSRGELEKGGLYPLMKSPCEVERSGCPLMKRALDQRRWMA